MSNIPDFVLESAQDYIHTGDFFSAARILKAHGVLFSVALKYMRPFMKAKPLFYRRLYVLQSLRTDRPHWRRQYYTSPIPAKCIHEGTNHEPHH